jgi:hypothetical protein
MRLPAFEELATLCDAKGWRLELAHVGSSLELRVRNLKGGRVAVRRASNAAHLGGAAMALLEQLGQKV